MVKYVSGFKDDAMAGSPGSLEWPDRVLMRTGEDGDGDRVVEYEGVRALMLRSFVRTVSPAAVGVTSPSLLVCISVLPSRYFAALNRSLRVCVSRDRENALI